MPSQFRRFGSRFSLAPVVFSLLSLAAAHAQDAPAERLTDVVPGLNRPDLIRNADSGRQGAPKPETSTAQAGELRKLARTRATTFEAMDEWDRAEAEYDALVDMQPVDPTAYIDRGYFHMRQGRFDAAMRDFIAGSRLAPGQSAFSFGAGRALARMGDHSAAIRQYDEALRLAPSDSTVMLSRAEAYEQIGMYAQARADFDRAIALGPRSETDRFFAYFGRGYANIRLGNDDAAVRDLDVALTMRPRMAYALVWRGYARERLGQRVQALSDYELALKANPDDNWIRSSIRRVRA